MIPILKQTLSPVIFNHWVKIKLGTDQNRTENIRNNIAKNEEPIGRFFENEIFPQ